MPISTERPADRFWRAGYRVEVSAVIWALQFDENRPNSDVFLELRETDPRRVFFACLEAETGTLRWQIDSPGDAWWMRLVAVSGGTVFLHEYPNPELPEPRGLRALDAATGTVRWHDAQGVYRASDGIRAAVSWLDAIGSVQTEIRYLTNGQASTEPLGELPPSRTQVPHTYPASNAYFPVLADFVRVRTGHEPIRQMDYLEWADGDRIGISYYFYADDSLENRLLVVSRSTNTHWTTRIATEQKLGSTAFVVRDGRLFFVQDHVHLHSYVP